MKKRIWKKVLSLVLAFSLLAPLIPAIPAVATEEELTFEKLNLITNGGFEEVTDYTEVTVSGTTTTGLSYSLPTNWNIASGLYYNSSRDTRPIPRIETDATVANEGQRYLRTGLTGNGKIHVITPMFEVDPGDTIVLKYFVKADTYTPPYTLRGYDGQNYTDLQSYEKITASTAWEERTYTVTISNDYQYDTYGFWFYVGGLNDYFNRGWTLDFDDVRAYKLNAEYITCEINAAIDEKDETALDMWMSHELSGITDVNRDNISEYMSNLITLKEEQEKNLSSTAIQEVVDGVNDGTLYVLKNLVANGNFEDVSAGQTTDALSVTLDYAVPNGWKVYNNNFYVNSGRATSANPGVWPNVLTNNETAQSGSKYLQIAPSGGSGVRGVLTPSFEVKKGETILVKYWVKNFKVQYDYLKYELWTKNTDSTYSTLETITTNGMAQWTEVSKEIPISEDNANYELGFIINKYNAWPDAISLDIDNVRVYKLDAGYVLYEINAAIDAKDETALNTWISHSLSGLSGVKAENISKYMSNLVLLKAEQGKNLSRTAVQEVIDGVNNGTLYILNNLITNGDFEKTENCQVTDGAAKTLDYAAATEWEIHNLYANSNRATTAANGVWPHVLTDTDEAQSNQKYMQIAAVGNSRESGVNTPSFAVRAGETIVVKYWVKGRPSLTYELRANSTALQTGLTASNTWTETSHLISITEDNADYKLGFIINKFNAYGDIGYVMNFDDVRVYKVDKDYVVYEMNEALAKNDKKAFYEWFTYSLAELTEMNEAYLEDYYTAILAERTEKDRKLSHNEIQAVVKAVNTGKITAQGNELVSKEAKDTKVEALPGETYYVEANVSGNGNVQMKLEQWNGAEGTEPGKQSTSTHAVGNQATRIYNTFTMNIDYDRFSVSFEGATSIESVTAYLVNKALVLRNINVGAREGNEEFFYVWASHEVSDLVNVKEYNIQLYVDALREVVADKDLSYAEIQAIIAGVNWKNKPYETVDIGTQLELFVEDTLIDTDDTTVKLVQQLPEEKGVVLEHDYETYAAYYSVFKDDDIYRMYYRGVDDTSNDGGATYPYNTICYAESTDGVNWTRPNLGICDFNGSKQNNIIFDFGTSNGAWKAQDVIECFSAFKDTNPNTTPDALYKGVLTVRDWWGSGIDGKDGNSMYAFKSADGIHWEVMNDGKRIFDGRHGHGHLDSHNTIFWKADIQKYVMYFRKNLEGTDDGYVSGILRATATLTSDDFVTWDTLPNATPLEYEYEAVCDDGYVGSLSGNYQTYTNGVFLYDRAPYMYLGLPTRYLNAQHEVAPYLMASRDGVNFKWWSQMLSSVEGDKAGNRANYAAQGIARTSDTEYSMYVDAMTPEYPGYVQQFTFRVDGFVAAHGDASGNQTLLTKPIKFAGDHLILNYVAGQNGSVVARLLDTKGNVIEGFDYTDCTTLIGDSIGEELKWTGDLADLIGTDVKIQFKLTNADLYSYQFMKGKPIEFEKVSKDVITGVESTRLNWTTSEFALSYKITLAEDIGFTKGVKEYTSLANFVDVSGLDASKSYFWKVEAIGAEGTTMVTDIQLNGYTVTLGGKLGVNFYMNLSDDVVANAVMRFTHNGKTTEIAAKDAEKTAYGYKFTYEVVAKQMSDAITAQLFNGDTAISDAYTYSVKEYADTIIANEKSLYSSNTIALAKAMLNYGANAQTYFKYNTNALANANLKDVDKALTSVTADTLANFANTEVQSNAAIGTLEGSSLVLESETTLKFYFKLADGVTVSDLEFKVGNSKLDAVQSGNYYYVALENIAAHNLNDPQQVKVTKGTSTLEATYNVMTYCYNVLSRETTDTRTEALKDVVKAMYLYNQAADAYLEGGQ